MMVREVIVLKVTLGRTMVKMTTKKKQTSWKKFCTTLLNLESLKKMRKELLYGDSKRL